MHRKVTGYCFLGARRANFMRPKTWNMYVETAFWPCLQRGGTEIVMEQKIKQDKIQIGKNIRRIRKQNKLKQTDMVVRLQLMGMDMTREALVKIERGIQHIYASQLKAIKEVLGTTYDELLSEDSSEEK